MTKDLTPRVTEEVTPKAEWLAAIPKVEDTDEIAWAIAAAIASASSVEEALAASADTVPMGSLTGHKLRVLQARLLESTMAETEGYYAVIDAIDLSGGHIGVERIDGSRVWTEELDVAPGDRLAVTCGAASVLAVLAVAYGKGQLPFETTPYGVASKSNPGRVVLKLGPLDTAFD